MWHKLEVADVEAFRKVDTHGRIIGRINLKEGEYSASKVVVDDDGIGHAKHVGFYLTLENAKTAVDSNETGS